MLWFYYVHTYTHTYIYIRHTIIKIIILRYQPKSGLIYVTGNNAVGVCDKSLQSPIYSSLNLAVGYSDSNSNNQPIIPYNKTFGIFSESPATPTLSNQKAGPLGRASSVTTTTTTMSVFNKGSVAAPMSFHFSWR